jgi:hypothetical protein
MVRGSQSLTHHSLLMLLLLQLLLLLLGWLQLPLLLLYRWPGFHCLLAVLQLRSCPTTAGEVSGAAAVAQADCPHYSACHPSLLLQLLQQAPAAVSVPVAAAAAAAV